MMRKLRPSTRQTYASHWNKWVCFAEKEGYNPLFPTDASLTRLLFFLENKGDSTNVLKGVRAAIGSLGSLGLKMNISSGPLTTMFMEGRVKSRPQKPRYTKIWSPVEMLTWLDELQPADHFQWNVKVVGLLKLLLLFRDDDLHGLRRQNIKLERNRVSYRLFQPKTLRHGDLTDEYTVSSSTGPCSLVECIRGYLDFTKSIEIPSFANLVINSDGSNTSKTRYASISSSLMRKMKIDVNTFKSHSFRSAGATWMIENGLSIPVVMKIGRWVDQRTFVKHYLRCAPQLSAGELDLFAKTVASLPTSTQTVDRDGSDSDSDSEESEYETDSN